MERRGVTEEDIEWALKRPEGDPSPGQPGTIWIDGWASGDRILRVCVTVDRLKVVTVAWRD